jgi:hypothetical protein
METVTYLKFNRCRDPVTGYKDTLIFMVIWTCVRYVRNLAECLLKSARLSVHIKYSKTDERILMKFIIGNIFEIPTSSFTSYNINAHFM